MSAFSLVFQIFVKGEYLATKSQNDVFSGEISLEKLHIDRYHSDEVEEVQVLLNKIGISENTSLTNQLVKYYRENDEALLQLMMALEFGFIVSSNCILF